MEGGKEKCERDRCGWEEIMKEETGKEEIIVKKTEMKEENDSERSEAVLRFDFSSSSSSSSSMVNRKLA